MTVIAVPYHRLYHSSSAELKQSILVHELIKCNATVYTGPILCGTNYAKHFNVGKQSAPLIVELK